MAWLDENVHGWRRNENLPEVGVSCMAVIFCCIDCGIKCLSNTGRILTLCARRMGQPWGYLKVFVIFSFGNNRIGAFGQPGLNAVSHRS